VIAVAAWSAVAVAVRLWVAWASGDAGIFADMTQYHERAVLLASGQALPDALRGPGYPALLALAYHLGGTSFWSARVANALVGGLLTAFTGWLAGRAGAGRHAWVASAIVALYPSLVLSSVYLMPDSAYATLVVLALLLVRHRAPWMVAIGGGVTGAAIVTRSVGVALVAAPIVLGLWTWWTRQANPRVVATRLAAFAVGCGIVLTPWLAFTTRVAGGPLLDATSGVNMLLGSHDGATGRLSLGDEGPLRERHVVGAATTAEGNARAIAAALAWARAHPGDWLRLGVAKLGYLFGLEGREHAWLYGNAYFGPRHALTVTAWAGLVVASFPVLIVAALAGLVRRTGPVNPVLIGAMAFTAATCVLHVFSFGESRFHLPLMPLLAVAASLGAARTGTAWPRGRLLAASVVLTILAWAWAPQALELAQAANRLRAPDGWMSAPDY
jgi:4-amino-4-deoxy-L-arabinose transferase-like glycosyltransferase